MVKFNFLDRFKRKKAANDSSGRLSGLSRQFNKWRQRSARSLAALLPSSKHKNEVQSSTKQRRTTEKPGRSSLLSLTSLFKRKRSRQLEQTSAPLLSLNNDSSSSDESMEVVILDTPSSNTLESQSSNLSTDHDQVSTRHSALGQMPEDEVMDLDSVTSMGEGTDDDIVMSNTVQLSGRSNINNNNNSSAVDDDMVCADEACECVDHGEASKMEDAGCAELASCAVDKDDMMVLCMYPWKPEEKPPPSGHTSGKVQDDSANHDLLTIVASFVITMFTAGLIMTVAF
ncbi:uncharacterized protein [Dysidea avara]|uniref:uncharacterized protein n=1 Tax=Dysidea avara TaxID=196820 RepID=UPI00331E2F00